LSLAMDSMEIKNFLITQLNYSRLNKRNSRVDEPSGG
jgi:hypothetical protein